MISRLIKRDLYQAGDDVSTYSNLAASTAVLAILFQNTWPSARLFLLLSSVLHVGHYVSLRRQNPITGLHLTFIVYSVAAYALAGTFQWLPSLRSIVFLFAALGFILYFATMGHILKKPLTQRTMSGLGLALALAVPAMCLAIQGVYGEGVNGP